MTSSVSSFTSLVTSLVATVHTIHAPVFAPRSTCAILPSSTVVCFDAKINFDDNAEFRQKDVFAMDDMTESDPLEMEAAKWDLKYIGLDGNIACFGTTRKWKRANFSARRTRQAVNELDHFLAKGFNASPNSYRIEAQTQLKLDKEKTAWAFLHFTLHAAFWGLQEECRRNQCVLISYNPPRNSPVSQIVSTLIKGPPLLS